MEHLLATIGKDGNNQMLTVAFAVVEAETKEAWDWFLELLLAYLNGIEARKWSFISDQQKVYNCCLFNKFKIRLIIIVLLFIYALILFYLFEGNCEHNCINS